MFEQVVHIVYRMFQTVNLTDYCTEMNLMTEWTNSRLPDDTVPTARLAVFNETWVRNWKPEKSFLRQPTTQTSLEGFPPNIYVENVCATPTLILWKRNLSNITGKWGSQEHQLIRTTSQLVICFYLFCYYYFFVISDKCFA